MRFDGWLLLLLSWITILSLTVYCFSRILGIKKENIKAPLEIDTEEK